VGTGPYVVDDVCMTLPSFMSVFLRAVRPLLEDPKEFREIIQGTGFVLRHDGLDYLITNGHIVTGRDRIDDTPLGRASLPTFLEVAFPMSGSASGSSDQSLIGLARSRIDLYDEDGNALWFVHPVFGRVADVVALPLNADGKSLGLSERITLLPYALGTVDPVPSLDPTSDVSIVGFPFGLTGGAGSALWVRGTIASEPDLPYSGEPCFLVDARSRSGQSGSPVIQLLPQLKKGSTGAETPLTWSLVGVYSGRLSDESDLGRIWRWSVLKAVVESRVRDTLGPDD
jgi:hypothetical protein